MKRFDELSPALKTEAIADAIEDILEEFYVDGLVSNELPQPMVDTMAELWVSEQQSFLSWSTKEAFQRWKGAVLVKYSDELKQIAYEKATTRFYVEKGDIIRWLGDSRG
jgi:hypothetical protein